MPKKLNNTFDLLAEIKALRKELTALRSEANFSAAGRSKQAKTTSVKGQTTLKRTRSQSRSKALTSDKHQKKVFTEHALPSASPLPNAVKQLHYAPVYELQESAPAAFYNSQQKPLADSGPAASKRIVFSPLFEQACINWLTGNTASLVDLSLPLIQSEPARHLLAALHASALLSHGRLDRAREAIAQAVNWGLEPAACATFFIAGAHRHLASAYASRRDHIRYDKHMRLAGAEPAPYTLHTTRNDPNGKSSSTALGAKRGLDPASDIHRYLPGFVVRAVFDVGANTGQSTAQFLKIWPDCLVYCFEPSPSTFKALTSRYGSNMRVRLVNAAISESNGLGVLHESEDSAMTHLQSSEPPGFIASGHYVVQQAKLITLDTFCSDHNVTSIDYLKVDTEGHDLSVLKGAQRLLSSRSVCLVQIEAAMNPLNPRHVQLESVKKFLEQFGYLLFGVYDQTEEWITKQPQLRRANLLFVSPNLIEAASGSPPTSLYDRPSTTAPLP